MLRPILTQLISILIVIVFAKRLPNSLVPKEYELEIMTNLVDESDIFTFEGSVLIRMKCLSPTDVIILHSKNLKIYEKNTIVRCLNATDVTFTVLYVLEVVKDDFLILKLSNILKVDAYYELELHFKGGLNEQKVGYYRSAYFGYHGEKRWMGVTYFKPDNARRAFPCFDEPRFKANFTIRLGRSRWLRSVSNMPLLRTIHITSWEVDEYQATPPMSTYAVGFAIFDYPRETFSLPTSDVDFSVFGSRKTAGLMDTCARLCGWFTLLFEKHLNKTYPLPKLDVLVLPDYAVPAMESWGLIVLDEKYLLRDSATSLTITLKILANAVAEQIAHQWIGNLVTMKSWADVWFTEGLSNFLSVVAADQYLPGWESLLGEITASIISVFQFDSLEISYAISIPSNQSGSSGVMLRPKSLKKAALVVRMLSHFLGFRNLHEGIQKYVDTYQYSNAGSDELLDHVNNASLPEHVDVKTVIETWISQAGFPLITVTRDYERGTLEVKQERFFRNMRLLGKDTTRWWIPLTYTTECELKFNKTTTKEWLSPNMDSITINGPISAADWVIFNIEASAPYMVDYDKDNWSLLIDFLYTPFFEQISPLNRVLLIQSAANLAWIGRLNYRIFLGMIKYLKRENDFHPWNAALSCINELNVLLKRMPVHKDFVDYISRILAAYFDGYGISLLDDDMDEDIGRVGKSDSTPRIVPTCVEQDEKRCPTPDMLRGFQRNMNTDILNSVVEAFQETFFCITVKQSTSAEWDHSWNRYAQPESPSSIDNAFLRSLACTNNQTLLWIYLTRSIKDKYVKREETATLIIAVVRNKNSFNLITIFLSANFGTIYKRLLPDVQKLSAIILEVARYVIEKAELQWLREFTKIHRKYLLDVKNEIKLALEIAKLNLQWHRRNYRTIASYLKEYKDQIDENDFDENDFDESDE